VTFNKKISFEKKSILLKTIEKQNIFVTAKMQKYDMKK